MYCVVQVTRKAEIWERLLWDCFGGGSAIWDFVANASLVLKACNWQLIIKFFEVFYYILPAFVAFIVKVLVQSSCCVEMLQTKWAGVFFLPREKTDGLIP